MAAGKAAVATPEAIAGLRVVSGEQLLTASAPGEFAEAALKIIRDERLRVSLGRQARRFVEIEHDWTPLLQKLAELLEMTPREISNMLRGTNRHVSVDAPINGEESDATMLDVLINDGESSPDNMLMEESLKDEVQHGLSMLSPREVEVLSAYYGLNGYKSLTLEEIGTQFGLTRERVRHIKERAIRRRRKSYNRNALRSYLG